VLTNLLETVSKVSLYLLFGVQTHKERNRESGVPQSIAEIYKLANQIKRKRVRDKHQQPQNKESLEEDKAEKVITDDDEERFAFFDFLTSKGGK
jgi:hypothetical protein